MGDDQRPPGGDPPGRAQPGGGEPEPAAGGPPSPQQEPAPTYPPAADQRSAGRDTASAGSSPPGQPGAWPEQPGSWTPPPPPYGTPPGPATPPFGAAPGPPSAAYGQPPPAPNYAPPGGPAGPPPGLGQQPPYGTPPAGTGYGQQPPGYSPGPPPPGVGQPPYGYGTPPGGYGAPPAGGGRKTGLWVGVGIGGAVIVALLVVVAVLGFHALTSQRQQANRSAGGKAPSASEVSTNFVKFQLAKGWTVNDEKAGEVDLQSTGDAQMFVVFGQPSNGVTTPDQAFGAVKTSIAQRATSGITSCSSEAGLSVGGKQGKITGFRYTQANGTGSGSVENCEVVWVAIVGGNYYEWEDVAVSSEQSRLEADGGTMRQSVTWKQ